MRTCLLYYLKAIVDFLIELNENFTIVCSGKNSNFCLEDFVCAGVIIKELISCKPSDMEYVFSDVEIAALELAEKFVYENGKVSDKKILDMMKITEHGKFLTSLGFEKDLVKCSEFNSLLKLPIYSREVIRLKEQIEKENNQRQTMKKININGEKEN